MIRDWSKRAEEWTNRHRPSTLLGVLTVSVSLAAVVNWWTGSDLFRQFFFPKHCIPNSLGKCDPVEWKELLQAIVLTLGLPVAFLLWHWRDRNVRDQIENARKEINLKEFQELQLRAAGAISTDIPEKSRQTLWISALHQMRGYLRGEYGASFKRPALEVYCALIERQKRSEKTDNPDETNPEPDFGLPDSVFRTVRDIIFEEWKCFFWEDFTDRIGWPLQGRSLRRICLPAGAILDGLDLSRTDFSGSELNSVSFAGATLWDANFQGCDLRSAILTGIEGDGVILDQADMAGMSAEGADFSRSSFKETKFHAANLEGANFFKASGSQCLFVNVNLCGANFNGSRLYGCDFQNSKLVSAKFVSAQVLNGRISGADLSGSDLSYAFLDGFFPEQAASCAGATINARTTLPHPILGLTKELLSSEKTEARANWVKHGAILVDQGDDMSDLQTEQDDERIRKGRELVAATRRILEVNDGTSPL